MVLRVIIASLASLILSVVSPTAQPATSDIDPDLRAAAYQWLHRENMEEALAEIGRIGAEGNIHAQVLANRIFSWLSADFPDLERSERMALFGLGERAEHFRPFRVPIDETLPYAAASRMVNARSPEEWLANAEILLNAGLRENFLFNYSVLLSIHTDFLPEITEFVELHLRDSDYAQYGLWYALLSDGQVFSYGIDDRQMERWGESPWTDSRQEEFFRAVSEGRWSAIRAGAGFARFRHDAALLGPHAERLQRLASILNYARYGDGDRGGEPPSHSELMQIGALLRLEAENTPYLFPFRNACASVCPEAVDVCMGATIVNFSVIHSAAYDFEPVIRAEDYYASARASESLLSSVALIPERQPAGASLLPSCLVNAVFEHSEE